MLDTDDLRTIGPAATNLAKEIADALSADSDGGKRITKEEGKRILTLVGTLLVTLIKDIID